MGRQALHSDTVTIDQKSPVVDVQDREEGNIILVDKEFNKDWAADLAFSEEQVTIILNPSSEKNAPTSFPVWVNGKGAEVFQNGRWDEIGYLPVGRPLIIRRKVLEVIMRSKLDSVTTQHDDSTVERPHNRINRATSAVHSYSILDDKSPKGAAWAKEMIRRNM